MSRFVYYALCTACLLALAALVAGAMWAVMDWRMSL